jgi:uncharacterized membrane protein YeaQ/YmgE (transglycosylase-associated protein family)
MSDPVTIDQSMTAASAAGGLASALANRSADSRSRKAMDGAVGAIVAIFGGPAVADLANVQQENGRIAIALVLGLTGAVLVTLLMDQVKAMPLKDWLTRFTGAPKP